VEILLAALRSLGVEAEASGRNDLLVPFNDGPRKFSGSAYREKRDRAFHHGTLLLSADLSRLGNYLTPSPKKLKAKGKESVRARVANLAEIRAGISHDQIVAAMIDSFEGFYGGKAATEHLSLASLNSNPELKAKYDELSSWNWLYGHTLEFTHRMDEYLSLGFFDFQFVVEEGIIREAQVFTDSLYPTLSEELGADLKHQAYLGESVKAALRRAKEKYPEIVTGLDELEAWLLREIEI
jgi:lipoate-protein ligase A